MTRAPSKRHCLRNQRVNECLFVFVFLSMIWALAWSAKSTKSVWCCMPCSRMYFCMWFSRLPDSIEAHTAKEAFIKKKMLPWLRLAMLSTVYVFMMYVYMYVLCIHTQAYTGAINTYMDTYLTTRTHVHTVVHSQAWSTPSYIHTYIHTDTHSRTYDTYVLRYTSTYTHIHAYKNQISYIHIRMHAVPTITQGTAALPMASPWSLRGGDKGPELILSTQAMPWWVFVCACGAIYQRVCVCACVRVCVCMSLEFLSVTYVCMCVCMYVIHIHIHSYTHTYVICMHLFTCTHTYIYMYTYKRTCIHISLCMILCMIWYRLSSECVNTVWIHAYAHYMSVCMYMRVHIYTDTTQLSCQRKRMSVAYSACMHAYVYAHTPSPVYISTYVHSVFMIKDCICTPAFMCMYVYIHIEQPARTTFDRSKGVDTSFYPHVFLCVCTYVHIHTRANTASCTKSA